MPAEVEADCKKVLDAYAKAMEDVSDDAKTGLTGMKNNIDDWCARGRKAASTRNAVPGAAGWPGWIKAGTIYLDGIKDIDDTLSSVVLDAITAQALNAPATTVKATKEAVHTIAKKATAAAHEAVHAVEEVGSGITKMATRVGMAAAAVLVLVVVLK